MKPGLVISMMASLAWTGMSFGQTPELPPKPVTVLSSPVANDHPTAHAAIVGARPVHEDHVSPDGPPVCDPPDVFFPDHRVSVSAEYLLWDIKKAPVPPLQTMIPLTSFGTGTVQLSTTLPDGGQLDPGAASGVRLTTTYLLDPDCFVRAEGSYFQLEKLNPGFSANVNGDLLNTLQLQTQQQVLNGTVVLPPTPISIVLPAHLTENAHGSASNRLWGLEANVRCTPCYGCFFNFDCLAGFRYLNLDEGFVLSNNLTLDSSSTPLVTPTVPLNPDGSLNLGGITNPGAAVLDRRTQIVSFDHIVTRNQFYGLQVGGSMELRQGNFFFNGTGKVGVGGIHQSVRADGSTTSTNFTLNPITGSFVPSQPALLTPGGLLTPMSGPVHQSREQIGFLPEATLKVGYQCNKYARIFVAYNAIVIDEVVRPADQIGFARTTGVVSLNGTPTQVNVTQPAFRFSDSYFWAQGVNVGLEFQY